MGHITGLIDQHWPWVSAHGFTLLAGAWAVFMGLLSNNNAQKAALYDEDIPEERNKLKSEFNKITDFQYKFFIPISMFIVLAIIPYTNEGVYHEYAEIGFGKWFLIDCAFSLIAFSFFFLITKNTKNGQKPKIIILSSVLAILVVAIILRINIAIFSGVWYNIIGKLSILAMASFICYLVAPYVKLFLDKNKMKLFWFSAIFNCIVYASLLYGIAIFTFNIITKYGII